MHLLIGRQCIAGPYGLGKTAELPGLRLGKGALVRGEADSSSCWPAASRETTALSTLWQYMLDVNLVLSIHPGRICLPLSLGMR